VFGNIGVFASSYDILQGLLDAGLEELVERPIFVERKGMRETERAYLIERYKRSWRERAILLGVQGGRNSEGEDFPGPYMSTSVIVGMQFMKPGIVRSLTLSLWRRYSRLDNPELLIACRSAAQAAARPVRSSDDLGFVVFADDRFKLCLNLFPGWLRGMTKVASLEDVPQLADEFFSSNGYLLEDARVPLDGVNSSTIPLEGRPLEKGY
ncbi:MAG: helicase C-terminal domain-containing protein, partial [Candidatus Korarchaeota archaeon]|nr:helicase C-terminal domain-containing protein [Candidatus Korarchaeota archaeon]